MDDKTRTELKADPNGLATYEYIANNIDNIDGDIEELVDNIISVDKSGQFVVSTARYLTAIGRNRFEEPIDKLIKAAILLDKQRVYLAELAATVWGNDYKEHATELIARDDNFRRLYKRLYPTGI